VGAVSWVEIGLVLAGCMVGEAGWRAGTAAYWRLVVARCVIDDRPSPRLKREQYRRIAHASRVLLPGQKLTLYTGVQHQGGQP